MKHCLLSEVHLIADTFRDMTTFPEVEGGVIVLIHLETVQRGTAVHYFLLLFRQENVNSSQIHVHRPNLH